MDLQPRLKGSVVSLPNGAIGLDTDTPLDRQLSRQLRRLGYSFCIRYLSRGSPEEGDLSHEEAREVLSAGLALAVVQHAAEDGWEPTKSLGDQYGAAAGTNAQEIGLPPGVNVWCDLEGVGVGVPSDSVIAYCQAWFEKVVDAQYVPGLYVGYNCGLCKDELYWNLSFQHYWRATGDVSDVSERGYQLFQGPTNMEANQIKIDIDCAQTDSKQGRPLFLRHRMP